MRLPSRRSERRALTASAVRLSRRESEYVKRLNQPWQERALFYYENVGELHFACQFIARMMTRVRFYPARQERDGKLTEITEGEPVDALARIQDPGGGRSQLQFDYGRLMMITGEGVLFGSYLETEDERWRFLWRDEVKIADGGGAVRLNAQGQETGETGVAYRFWTPSPRHSDEPDSPMRAILPIAEELVLLTGAVAAAARSRNSAGILAFAQGLSPNPPDPGEDEDPERNPFLKDMIEHMTAGIEEPGNPANLMPFLWEMPLSAGERIPDVIQTIKLHDPATDYMEREMRTEAIKRAALSMDMPPEALLGMTDANHWTAKQVMHDMWRSHGVVKAEQFGDALNQAYLRPDLIESRYPGAADVVIGIDDSQVVISPDRTDDADKALDRIAIGFTGYREMKGIPESYAPDDAEREFLASLKLRQPVDMEDGELVIPQRGPVAQTNGNAPEDGPPEPVGNRTGSRQEASTASIMGAAALALRQCRARAGARIRSYQHECEDCKNVDAPNSLVASVLGEALVRGLKLDPLKLVAGGTGEFQGILSEWGFEEIQAKALCQRLERYAADTLFHPVQPELPPGFMAQVAQAEEVSYAVEH